jgi:hypothetical protein
MTKRVIAGAAAFGLFCLASGIAVAKDDGNFESGIIGSTPGQTIAGVSSGGAPWTVRDGEASVGPSGRIEVEVKGLLLTTGAPPALVGTTGPVANVAASLVCGGSGGTVVASTGGVPLSAAGNAEIEQAIPVPASCIAPVILIRIFNATAASPLGAFIAASGFTD